MYNSKSVTERLKNFKSQSNLSTAPFGNSGCDDEYPRLRKPKAATLLKIQGHQTSAYNIATSMIKNKEGIHNVDIPLRQEFINKKEHLQKAALNLLNKYEVKKNLLDKRIHIEDSVEALPFKFITERHLQLNEAGSSNPNGKTNIKSLNCRDQLLVNIFYTKIKAHPNGLFAENLPNWYKQTFDKDLDSDWLEVLAASNIFDIEEILNKIVLYVKDEPIIDTDLINVLPREISTIKSEPKQNSMPEANDYAVQTESSVNFVRYKHLQKSFKEYS